MGKDTKKDALANASLMFPFLLTSIYNQALKLLEQSGAKLEDIDLPKEEKSKDIEEEKEAKEFLDSVKNGVNYFYSDDCKEEWKELNDDSEADTKMKDILDNFIFKVRTRQPDVEYNIRFDFHWKDGKKITFRFFWNKNLDTFEGTCSEFDDVFYYDELNSQFVICEDTCDDCCREEDENPKKEYVAPACEVTDKSAGAQITVQEFSEREAKEAAMKNTAKNLFDQLNNARQTKIENYLEEVKEAMKRIIDYSMFIPVTGDDGVVTKITFTADDLAANIPHIDYGDYETVLTAEEIINAIKDGFGFASVNYDTANELYTAKLV